jgi:hypothetical protein
MKYRALLVTILILASSSVQAHNESESMKNPMTDTNPASLMAAPMEMMAQMMMIPMKMMVEMMAIPMKMMTAMMTAPNDMTNQTFLMNPTSSTAQPPQANDNVPADGPPSALDQVEPAPQAGPHI